MMLTLVDVNDPVLLGKAESVTFPSPSLSRTYAGLLTAMIQNQGCGLAAPQVGIPLRIFAYRVGQEIGLVINPWIVERSAETIDSQEGCLSLPGEAWLVKRSKEIEVAHNDLSGNPVRRRLTGMMAVVFQHEMDHLDGVLICQIGKRVEINKGINHAYRVDT